MNFKNHCKVTICFFAVLVGLSCARQEEFRQYPVSIDIDLDATPRHKINVGPSNLLALETNDSSLIYGISFLEKSGGKYFIISRDLSKMYDVASGKYMGDFSTKGQGPGEYDRIGSFWIENDTLRLLDAGKRKLLSFSPDGKFLESKSTYYEERFPQSNYLMPLPDGQYLSVNGYAGGMGDPNPQYSLLSHEFVFIKDIPGRELLDGGYTSDRLAYDSTNGRAFGWDALKDTLYLISENGVEPGYIFNFGNKTFPAEFQEEDEMFVRTRKFNKNGETPYAGLLSRYQFKDNDMYFIFYDPDKDGMLLGEWIWLQTSLKFTNLLRLTTGIKLRHSSK